MLWTSLRLRSFLPDGERMLWANSIGEGLYTTGDWCSFAARNTRCHRILSYPLEVMLQD